MFITWYATASVSIIEDDTRMLFDPFITCANATNKTTAEDFADFDTIYLTHGHVDHLGSIKELMKQKEYTVISTMTPAKTLYHKGIAKDNLKIIYPGKTYATGHMKFKVYQGKHIKFDTPLLRNTIINIDMVKYIKNLPWLLKEMVLDPENNETIGYYIETRHQKIYLIGSLNYDKDVKYPSDIDILILPFQGNSDLITPALELIELLKPKTVILDHFDNAFPPLSKDVDTSSLIEVMAKQYPDIKVIVPKSHEVLYFK